MARFTNFATLSYNGGTTDSNTVTGELVEILSATKTAVIDSYTSRGSVTYVLSLVNSGTSELSDLTITDDLGGYAFGDTTVYPLAYTAGSVRLYINGTLQSAPTVTAGPPLVISGISVPAGGNAMLIYEADVTSYAPLGLEATITNNAVVTGGGLSAPLTTTAVIGMQPRAELSISKAICPASVTENGRLTYTFVIANSGSLAATADEQTVMSDTFSPILDPITVTLDGQLWSEGTHYTYDTTTGAFATLPGQITVPAASFAQGADGTWVLTPGTATLVITGTV